MTTNTSDEKLQRFLGKAMASLCTVLLLSACTAEPDESACVDERKLSANKLSANKLSANKLSANGLLSAALLEAPLTAAEVARVVPVEALEDELVQDVLEYTIGCALAPGQSIALDLAGGRRVYHGALGLAPQWGTESGSCDETCQGWVSACLIARTNAHGESVPISLLGDHPGLAPTPEELAAYDLEEATYYGQLFGPDKTMFACVPEGVEAPVRTCGGVAEGCAIAVVGACNEVCDGAGCRGTDGVAYAETITVSLAAAVESCG